MTIKAEIVADSINPTGNRLTTWKLYYPRCIHSELLTHRAFSRNSASSRAIPIERMIQRVLDDPFIPHWWGKAQPGMQADEEVGEDAKELAKAWWLTHRSEAVRVAYLLSKDAGLHKQIVNRLLEPWMHIEVVVSATEWNNWFLLRDHHAAEPHIRELAAMMHELYGKHEPVLHLVERPLSACTQPGFGQRWFLEEWHLPFVKVPFPTENFFDLIKESVAHCAWVSYGNVDGKPGYTQADCDRVYDKLVGAQPIHASPTEHVAVACSGPHRHGNLTGWCQWRKFLPGESGGDYSRSH